MAEMSQENSIPPGTKLVDLFPEGMWVERAMMPDNVVYLIDPRAMRFNVAENGNIENPRRILDDENKPLAIIENLI